MIYLDPYENESRLIRGLLPKKAQQFPAVHVCEV